MTGAMALPAADSHDDAPLVRLLHHPEGRAVWDELVVPRLGTAGLAALALCGRAGRAERDKRREAGERVTPLNKHELYEEPELLAWAVDVLGFRVVWVTAYDAARHGYLEALQWLCAEGRLEEDLRVSDFCDYAAGGGQVHVLEWLRERGAPWGETCTQAAENGQLDALKWARERGAPWDEEVCEAAACNGCLEALKWLVASGCPFDRQYCLEGASWRLEVDDEEDSPEFREELTATVQWLEQLASALPPPSPSALASASSHNNTIGTQM